MTRVPFTKMEGCGNDYVFVDAIRDALPLARGAELARAWSHRHFGIGGDGLIVLTRGERAPVRMHMWNADGSRGAMCGNGLRGLAGLAFAHGHVRDRRFVVETDAGLRSVELLAAGEVRTGMGEVRVETPERLRVGDGGLELTRGSAGNPHAVVFVADVEHVDVPGLGALLQQHPAFPDGVNVEFVQVDGPDRLRPRTVERGSGATLAGGTGATVAALAARAQRRIQAEVVHVALRGGALRVECGASTLALVGPTRTVFDGEVELPR